MITQQLLRIYCQIRLAQYLLQFIANLIIPDHDAHVFNPPLWSLNNGSIIDTAIEKFFSGLRRWDAIYFLHISRFGYIYENSLAFFPAYPLLFIRPVAHLFEKILVASNAYLLSSISINFFLGFLNVQLLYRLALKYHLNVNHAYWSAILYMINPATIFFLAPYSETLFLCSQLLGHYYLKTDQVFYSCLAFAFGSTIRSNGMVSFGFIIYYYLQEMHRRKRILFPIHYCLLCLSPFFLTQYYLYREYCFEKDIPSELKIYGVDHDLPMSLSNYSSVWCMKTIPLSYQYVQKTYWNVGLFNYWRWKQIPNFLLALPVYLLIGSFIKNWLTIVRRDLWKRKLTFLFPEKTNSKTNIWFLEKDFLPHIIYMLFLSLFALFLMHIQVSTRFLFSSGPFLYLISADRIRQHQIKNGNLTMIFYLFKKETLLFSYYLTYVVVGIILFSNFLPWT